MTKRHICEKGELTGRKVDANISKKMAEYLYDDSDSVGIDEAIADARKRWPKS